MYDKDIRKILRNKLSKNKSRLIDEYEVGSRRADLVEIKKNKMICYEIKSDRDNLKRLEGQIKEYSKFFDEIIVVVGEKYKDQVLDLIPTYCGIYLVESDSIKIIRKPLPHNKVKIKNVMSLLWKDELNQIIEENGFPKKYKRVAKTDQCKYIISEISETKLKTTCRNILLERKGWR